MSAHRARAARLLNDLGAMDDVATSKALVIAVWALAEATLATRDSQERLADALNHPPGYTVRKEGLGGGKFGSFRIESDANGGR